VKFPQPPQPFGAIAASLAGAHPVSVPARQAGVSEFQQPTAE
jgi:hypothetical protein